MARSGSGGADDLEQGRFRVDIRVAPSVPMSFLTLRLVQSGELGAATEAI
ncbi:MAG: hypothetical protein JNL97_07835 [Verrucomicrobiales bacterium]|nr:hypothetical protein [Verrucomicrobiales bacterium]